MQKIEMHNNKFKRSILKLIVENSVQFISWTEHGNQNSNEIDTVIKKVIKKVNSIKIITLSKFL